MASDYIPRSDLQLQDWLGNFITVGSANLTILGLTSADFTPISSDKGMFDTSITDNEAKQAAAKAATKKKELLRTASVSKARALVKRIQAKADVPADLKRQLQITVPGESSSTPPQVPMELTSLVIAENTFELSWKRNGNSPSTIFIIESSIGNSGIFTQIGAITKTTFLVTLLVPGQKTLFRVKATRNELQSPYSNLAIVNEGGVS